MSQEHPAVAFKIEAIGNHYERADRVIDILKTDRVQAAAATARAEKP